MRAHLRLHDVLALSFMCRTQSETGVNTDLGRDLQFDAVASNVKNAETRSANLVNRKSLCGLPHPSSSRAEILNLVPYGRVNLDLVDKSLRGVPHPSLLRGGF